MSAMRAADHPLRIPHFTLQISRTEIFVSLVMAEKFLFTMVCENRWKTVAHMRVLRPEWTHTPLAS